MNTFIAIDSCGSPLNQDDFAELLDGSETYATDQNGTTLVTTNQDVESIMYARYGQGVTVEVMSDFKF